MKKITLNSPIEIAGQPRSVFPVNFSPVRFGDGRTFLLARIGFLRRPVILANPHEIVFRMNDTEDQLMAQLEGIMGEDKAAFLQGLTTPPDASFWNVSASPIQLGEAHIVTAGYNADRKVTLLDLLLQAKEANSLGGHPKLVAVYTWMQAVKSMALAGQTDFPPSPHQFDEIVMEGSS